MPEFVHLHVHSEYSLLDGLSRTKGLAARAQEFGMPAVAITDHGTMFAAIEFHDACKAVGVKPIIGVEAYLAPRTMQDRDAKIDRSPYHLLLLAENETGYKNLLKISSIAQLEGFYQKPRVDKAVLEKLAQGVIATTGCMGAEIPTLLAQGKTKQARDLVDWYRQIFKDRFYVELQEHGIPELTQINPELIRIARDFNLKLVATNDVHYIKQDDWFAQDVLLCVQTGATVNQTDRMRMDGRDYWFKSAEEMAAVWADYPEALSTTLEIAERCSVDLSFKEYHLPLFPVPDGFTPESYLRAICEQGFHQRYPDASQEKIDRLNYELGVIHTMGFDTYFLIVWDLTRHARERGIWANARGSAAGSMVAYCLGITHLDPLEHNLIFERFLNPDRISMPDIDLDFPDDARQEMINYTVAKYGRENVAQIITFGKMLAKAALRDVGRALDYPLAEVDRVAKLIPVGPGKTIDGTLEEVKEFRELYENSEYLRKLIDNAKLLEGVARNASTHAAGVVVTDKPVIEYTPLHRPTRGDESGTPVTQFPMGDLEHIGLLKIDFLGLAHLTIVREACKLIQERHGIELTLQNIPVEDPKAFELLSRGDVVGVFQVEGGGLKRVLMQMRPTRFDHIVAAISLYRPGPMENIPSYIARLHGQEKIEYRHPALEPILGETFGICVSGDAIVFDVRTGRRLRLDQVGQTGDFHIQGIDADWRTATGRVTHWVHNGRKPVFQVRLRNGASIKVTADHRLLTENGWQMLKQLAVGDYIATPPELLTQENNFDSRKLRVLAYLLADGDLGNLASVNFVSKDSALLDEYERCLSAFENIEPRHVEQARQVTRVTVSKQDRHNYHQPNSLLDWLRTLGLKHPSGSKPGGLRSHEKFVPDFVFTLRRDDIAYFLASLWDCDGYVGNKLWHYKTISARLAQDVQTLLLKLGIPSTIYQTGYVAMRGLRSAYQVTVYDTARLAEWLQPFFVTAKREQRGGNREEATLARAEFLNEVESVLPLPKRVLMREYGIDRQHFAPRRRQSERISTHIASALTAQVALPETARRLRWEEIVSIEPAGLEDVYDLTVEGLHNFVANNIIVHNCVYQEQIIRMARDLCGFTGGEADTLRKAVGKKNKEAILKQREKFVKGAEKAGIIPSETAEKIFDDIEFFARYGFNKCLTADTRIVDASTGRITTIGALYQNQTTFDTPSLNENGRVTARPISAVMSNGVKSVYRLRTRSGREIRATANHPFRTFDGWTNLEDLRVGELIAAPRFIPYTPSTNLRAHEIVVLATALGEGNLCHPHSFYVYTRDEQQLADYGLHLEQFENTRAVIDRSKSAVSVYARRDDVKQPSGAVEFIQRVGLHGKRAVEKFIPDVVFGLPLDQLAMFMGRLWSADGCIHPKTLSMYYATSSREMAQQVQHLLLRFGMQATLHTKEFKYHGGIRVGYTINVLGGRAAVLRFSETIGAFLIGHTRENLAQMLALYTNLSESRARGTVEIVPAAIHSTIRTEMELRGLGPKQFSRASDIAERLLYVEERKRGFRRDTLAEIARALESETLRAHAESDIFWDEIESIEPDGIAETFDLTVPETHNFVANDLIVHNSHAAVYAVLTGQTAYLKAHYPLEYMTALLCTDIGNTEKVAMFVADARHQGIQVLPPDVRYSDMKFSIDDSVRGIRFGLLGVKNVGEGPIQAILDGRRVAVEGADGETYLEDKPFESLDDFCTRVDLKQVNRRVLESLIKAGAFDAFGARGQLLEAIDRMLSVSASHHNASAAGQMSLFGGVVAVDTFGDLPLADEVNHKTLLEWEKELMGVYFSPHPLLKLAEAGKKHVGAYTGEITHESDGMQVTLGGILKSVRQIITKKGDAMAFLNLEDPQGEIEVVAFPRTYNDCRDVIHEDALVLVRGKVQVRDDKIAVLADLIWNYPIETPKPEAVQHADRPIPGIFSNTPVIAPPPPPRVNDLVEQIVDDWLPPPGDWDADMTDDGAQTADDRLPTADSARVEQNAVGIENAAAPNDSAHNVSSDTAEPVLEWNAETAPPDHDDAPETTPTENAPTAPPLVLQSQVVAETKPAPPPAPPTLTPKAAVPEINLGSGVAIPSKNGGAGRGQHSAPAPRGNAAPAHVARENTSSYMPRTNSNIKVRVRFQRSYDQQLDTKRMREVVKLLRSADGRDRFALIVPLQSSWVELDFPNYYTNFQTVQQQLLDMVSDWGEVEIG